MEEEEMRLTEAAFTAAMEAYDRADMHSQGIPAAIQAALRETPTWIVEQYVAARRGEEE